MRIAPHVPPMLRRFLLALSMIVASVSRAHTQAVPPVGGATPALGERVLALLATGQHARQRWPLLRDVAPVLRQAYDAGDRQPLWSRNGVPTSASRLVVEQLASIQARGLRPADYDADRLRQLVAMPLLSEDAQLELEVTLSSGAARALQSLRYGRVSARAAHAQLDFVREPYDLAAAMRAMSQSTNPSLQFDEAEPPYIHYHLLKAAAARYRLLAQDSSLVALPGLRTMRPGMQDAAVPQLRRLLVALGDLASAAVTVPSGDSVTYDSTLVVGIRRFQKRQGFVDDGVVGPATLARLRRPFPARIAQMELTMERWRWLPHEFGSPAPIFVNVPAFRAYALTGQSDREADQLSMDVVVGDAFNHQTPVFSGQMKYLIFSPYWDVPPSITRKELLPKVARDAQYLARNNYEVVSNSGTVLGSSSAAVASVRAGQARIRQTPGPTNALGGVKFIFPNQYNVYMHDTPAQSVFSRVRRDASHGCIRLAEPAKLAKFLLRDQAGWDDAAIAAAMQGTTPRQVNFSKPIPVHIVYATSVAREDGQVLFYEDIYGHDATLTALLARGYPYAAR
jgi:murein L,D-transpeptidase YcbB/YkuD